MSKPEMRYIQGTKCELRSLEENGTPQIYGTGVIYESHSELLGGIFREIIMPSVFDNTDMLDVRGLFNHDPNYILGRTVSGTLRLLKHTGGLDYEIDPPTNRTISDLVLDPIKRGDVTGSSFAFKVSKDGDEWVREGDIVVRYVHKIERLYDVSPVTYPAYPETQAAQRSLEAWKQALDDKAHLKAIHQRAYRERVLNLINPNI